MLQDGALALGHETGGRFGQLLRIEALGGVGRVRLPERKGTVVQPSVGVDVDVGIVSVGQEIPADVVHRQGQVTASVVDAVVGPAYPMVPIIRHQLRPSRGRRT